MIGVFTNANENLAEGAAGAVGNSDFNEAAAGVVPVGGVTNPLGTQGFSLGFSQIGC